MSLEILIILVIRQMGVLLGLYHLRYQQTQRSNFVEAPVQITIHDLRGKEDSVNLDANALEVVKYNGSIQEVFTEGSEAQKTHYEEIGDMLKKRLGAPRVFIYHYSFRSRDVPTPDEGV